MAKATGTLAVSNSTPPRFTLVKLDDGQGSDYSQVTFVVIDIPTGNQLRMAISGNASSGVTEGTGSNTGYYVPMNNNKGGATGYYPIYRRGSTQRGYLYFTSKYGDYVKDNTVGDWESLWVATGSQSIMLEIRDGSSGSIDVDFNYGSSQGNFTLHQGGTTNKMYRDGYGYHINVYNVHGSPSIRQDYIAHGLYYVLDEARRRGELQIVEPSLAGSNTFVKIANHGYGSEVKPVSIRLRPSASAGTPSHTWKTAADEATGETGTLLNKPPFSLMSDDQTSVNNVKYYTISQPIKSGSVTYVPFAGAGGSGILSPEDFATYWTHTINALPIQISASISTSSGTGSISLTNDVDGTDGNVAISSSYQHSVDIGRSAQLAISGMTGGAAAGGGLSIMARTRLGSKLIAVGGITRDNVASGSIEVGHLNFVASEGDASWGGALADGDLIPIHDTSADTVRGIELVDLKSYLSASVITNLTASGDVLLGDATGDTVNVTGRFISSLVPKTDGLNDLGTTALAWNTVFAESGSFSDDVGIGNNLTVIDTVTAGTITTTGTVSGSAVTVHTATADKVVAKQVNTTSLTASGGMMIGNANSDDVSFLGGLITDLVPQNDSKVDLGTSSKQFAEAHIDTGHIDTVTATNVDGILGANTAAAATVTTLSATGDVDLGNATSDTITCTGQFDSDLIPSTDSARDLGTSAKQWAEAHIDTGYIDTVTATNVDGILGANSAAAATVTSLTATSLTASDGVMIGTANSDDLSILSGLITDLVPQNDEKVSLGSAAKQYSVVYAASASFGDNVGVGGTLTAIEGVTAGTVSGSTVNVQTLNIYGEISSSGTNTLIKKAHIHRNIVQNNSDAHGGLSYSSGRLSVGFRKKIFVRSDGSNISGSVPTKGMFATDAMATPYTTASLGAVAMSSSLMVYLNGVLLHGEHDLGDTNKTGSSAPHADYRINSGSGTSNQWKIFMNEDLALDSDDILTVTYLSGSGVNA